MTRALKFMDNQLGALRGAGSKGVFQLSEFAG